MVQVFPLFITWDNYRNNVYLHAMCLNHPETIPNPHLLVRGKIVEDSVLWGGARHCGLWQVPAPGHLRRPQEELLPAGQP